MGSLTSCIKKAGGHLRPEDKAAILARAAVLRAAGAKNKDASTQAVDERIAEVRALLDAATPPKADDARAEQAQNVAREPDAPYETDLFGEALPAPARRPAARSRQAEAGNVQPAPAVLGDTPAPAGEYAVRTIVGREVERHLGAARILTAADAAAATRYLYKSAVERFDGIVIDKDGKPIAVVGGFKGAPTQTAIYASTLIGELVRVPGAAGVWFSHNHPSGLSVLSRADEHLFGLLVDALRGSGIEPKGLLAVGDGTYSAALPRTLPGMPGDVVSQPIPAPKAGVRVPVIERELIPSTEALPEISSPAHAKDIAAKYYGQAKAPGFVLLDGQNFVAAWVPLPVSAMGELRGTGGLNAIYRAVSESNAVAAVLVHGGELDARMPGRGSLTISENIGAALRNVEVRVLDSIDAKTNTSAAERGRALATGPVFARSKVTPEERAATGDIFDEPAEAPLLSTQTTEDLRAKTDRAAAGEKADAAEQKRLADKEKADAQRDEFVLTGSERASDANAAQPDLLPARGISDLGEKIGGARKDTAESTREDEAGNVALFSRADSPATEGTWQPTEEQSEKVQSLNTALVNYGLGESWRSAYEPAAVPDSLPGFRQAVQAAFRRDVQPVAPTSPGFNIFNGVYIPEAPNTVFVNVESKQGFVQVAFHELWHDLRRTRPDLHRWFRSVARPYWRDTEGFREKLNRLLQPGEQAYSDGQALEELEANFLGDSMADPKFLKKLADDSPSKFRALVNTILSWLDRVAAKLRAGLGSYAYVADVQALQEHLRSVLVAYAEGQPIPAGPKPDGRAAFFARAPATDTPAFRRWFGDSKVVDAQGKPLPMYHGTAEDFSVFKPKQAGAIFFTDNPNFAEAFSVTSSEWMRERGLSPGQNLMPVYVKAESPFDTRKPEHVSAFTKKALELYGHTNGDGQRVVKPGTAPSLMSSEVLGEMLRNDFSNWSTVESDWGQKVIRSLGHDGFYVMEAGQRNLAVFEPTQVKSATGNHGTFDPGNQDIRFSRAEPAATTTTVQTASGSMTTETRRSAWLDATNRIQFAPGQWLYSAIGRAASPLLTKLGLKAASPEMRRLLRQMKLDVAKAQETAGAVAKDMLALDQGEREMVSDIIEKELKAGIAPPEHAVRLAAVMNQAMSAQSKELVRLGMLSEDAAKRWDGAYLPRFYESKLRPKVDAWADAVRKLIGRTPVMQGIKGKHLKGRGLYETIPSHELEKWQSMGWEVRDHEFDPQAPSPEVQVWRDFSREERDRMGEIRDAGFRFVMGYMQTQRDIAIGRMLEAIANDPNLSSRTQREGWARVPDGTVEGTGAKKYGKLAGRFVPPDVLSQLTALDEAQSEAWQFYRKAMGIWKLGKTPMNPVSHMNNVVSNLSMAHFAGVSYHRADKYFGALRDFIKKPPMLQEAKDAGLFLGTMNAEELVKDLPKELQELVTKSESQVLRGAKLTFDLMTFFLRKPLGAAYEAEDLFFRYLIYKDARQRGMEPQDAVDHAQRFIFTYDDLPKGARMIRDFGIPFFAYTYKAIPALLHTALTHPHRMLAPAAVLWGANALAYALATDDDDDWQEAIRKFVTDAEFRERVREKQKGEHEHLPPWMKGMTALLTPKAIRLGMDEVTELPLFIDVSRIIPGGDIFDVSPNAGGIPLPQPITPSHPLLSIATAMIANKDLWTGKDLVLKDADTSAEAAEKRAAWLWKQVSPAVAIGNYHWERTLNALAQATGSEVRVTWPLPDDIAARIPEAVAKTYTGTDRGGMPVQPGLAALQTVGIKVRPIDLDLAEKIDASNRQRLIRDIDAQLRTMRRLNGKRAVSDKALDEAIETANRKKDRLREGLTVDGNNRD